MNTIKLDLATVYILKDRDELSRSLAQMFVRLAEDAVERRGRFTVALSGGSSPRSLYSLLATPEYAGRVRWDKVVIFWGDERCVPLDNPESNYATANDSLLSRVDVNPDNVHPVTGQESNPAAAAENYERLLREIFAVSGDALPGFDLILLGLGTDGHTASLFPGTTALSEHRRLVVENHVDKLSTFRITFTFPVLNAASHVAFMVSGDDKKEILPKVLKPEPVIYPSQLVHPRAGVLEWYADAPAAEKLSRGNPAGS